ncbi:MAG: hypothetical protein ACYCYB_06815 [Candidatus Dormibacteria bacterium]
MSERGEKAELQRYFGSEDDVIGGTADNASYVYAHGLFGANAYDVPVLVRLVATLLAQGHRVTELIGDRGFSQDSKRAAGRARWTSCWRVSPSAGRRPVPISTAGSG